MTMVRDVHSKTKFKWNRPFSFDDFLPYVGMVAILVMGPGLVERMFVSHSVNAAFIPSKHSNFQKLYICKIPGMVQGNHILPYNLCIPTVA